MNLLDYSLAKTNTLVLKGKKAGKQSFTRWKSFYWIEHTDLENDGVQCGGGGGIANPDRLMSSSQKVQEGKDPVLSWADWITKEQEFVFYFRCGVPLSSINTDFEFSAYTNALAYLSTLISYFGLGR